MLDPELIHPEDWKCPFCGESFSEDDMIDTCNEPFNGNIIRCDSCNHEFDISIRFVVYDMGEAEEDEEDEE